MTPSAQLLSDLASATDGLALLGSLIPPYTDDAFAIRMCTVMRNIAKYKSATATVRQPGLARANAELPRAFAKEVLDYSRQARLVTLYMGLPVVGRYSHLLEMALVEHYRFNYPAAMYIGCPLVEGIALALAGWTLGMSQISAKQAVSRITPSKALSGLWLQLFKVLHKHLSNFISTMYQHTTHGLGVANLNRHYLLHALGNEYGAVPGNVYRVLIAIESLAALEQLNQTGSLLLPDAKSVPKVHRLPRENFYQKCVNEGLKDVSLAKLEFFAHHPHL